MKPLIVTVLLAIIVIGLAFEQSVGILRNPLVATTTLPTPTHASTNGTGPPAPSSGPTLVQFHTILLVATRGDPSCFFIAYYGRDMVCPAGQVEINNETAWSAFYYSGIIAGCNVYCPPLPQVDFSTRTVLLVSPGGETGPGWNFTLNTIVKNDDSLKLYGVLTRPGSPVPGHICYSTLDSLSMVLIVDIPKTNFPANLSVAVVQGPPCAN